MKITRDQAINIGNALSLDWKKYKLDEFLLGINEELEHLGTIKHFTEKDPSTIVGSIAVDHLNEDCHYYTKLKASLPNLGETVPHDLHHSALEENLAARAYRERAQQAASRGDVDVAKKYTEIANEEDVHEKEFSELLQKSNPHNKC
jgi:hypothetical protein